MLSLSVFAIPAQATDSPYISPEEAVSMAITAPNNIKNTVSRAVQAEVIGLNRSYTNLAARRNELAGKTSADTTDWSKTPDNPEDVANKINNILDLNAKPEDFIHLLEPIEEEEENKDNKNSEEKSAEEPITPDNNVQTEINNNAEPKQIEIEDDTVKHLSTRRRFGK